jgi:hypothetical protein
VSRQAIVEGYMDGQMSRRVFIRRLVATGVSAAAALSYASVLESDPAAAADADFYLTVTDDSFVQNPAVLLQGQGVEAHNSGTSGHNARDVSGLGLFNTGAIDHFQVGLIPPLPGAGTFSYRCDEPHAATMKGKLQVPIVITPVQGQLGRRFSVRWSLTPAPAGLVFDVQRKLPRTTAWTVFRTGVTARSAFVIPNTRGNFRYRARVRRPSTGKFSGWSPEANLRVT